MTMGMTPEQLRQVMENRELVKKALAQTQGRKPTPSLARRVASDLQPVLEALDAGNRQPCPACGRNRWKSRNAKTSAECRACGYVRDLTGEVDAS